MCIKFYFERVALYEAVVAYKIDENKNPFMIGLSTSLIEISNNNFSTGRNHWWSF